jgi:hypothetical protein
LKVVAGGLPDLTGALAWAVRVHDRLFTTADMIHVRLEQSLIIGGDGERHYQWTGVVSGVVAEHAVPAEGC